MKFTVAFAIATLAAASIAHAASVPTDSTAIVERGDDTLDKRVSGKSLWGMVREVFCTGCTTKPKGPEPLPAQLDMSLSSLTPAESLSPSLSAPRSPVSSPELTPPRSPVISPVTPIGLARSRSRSSGVKVSNMKEYLIAKLKKDPGLLARSKTVSTPRMWQDSYDPTIVRFREGPGKSPLSDPTRYKNEHDALLEHQNEIAKAQELGKYSPDSDSADAQDRFRELERFSKKESMSGGHIDNRSLFSILAKSPSKSAGSSGVAPGQKLVKRPSARQSRNLPLQFGVY